LNSTWSQELNLIISDEVLEDMSLVSRLPEDRFLSPLSHVGLEGPVLVFISSLVTSNIQFYISYGCEPVILIINMKAVELMLRLHVNLNYKRAVGC